ncbi:hypothetical protein ZYGR_0AD00730 [Zygosaccharomyces rouxii]|uniref:ZYRO0G07568p n=2 Tax=Zygosaccharomyces rouxii TaxID=4956 RepID=C5DZV7_ZYGRC|nr:uncharacterized protein ZYRO0G07568g [Zygosaccharomyces rouxii]KAH9202388.1 hypothetical protein LQ764DRAFT_207369 [Zygosaccharomyces rouxii]GAV50890.1 hypothetical protein ZYGR_0AD00730 [Zygosaccharomyces rouxii]CAR29391.1 ZYRO0G07568p [Zygosaccharomyces rouxii]
MVDTNLKFWSTLVFAAFKRRPENPVFGYKRNVIKMRNAHGKRIESLLKKPDLHVVDLELDGTLETAHVSRIRELLLKDARAPTDSTLRIFRNGKVPKQGQKQEISDWKYSSLLFKNALNPKYGLPLSKLNAHEDFLMNKTILLESESGEEKLDRILWPSAVFSHSCRGIGIPTETYRQYREKYGTDDKIPKLVNPLPGDPFLKLYPVDFVPSDFQAVGLFPNYVETHKNVFKGFDLFGALVKSRLCTESEIKLINQRVITKEKPSSYTPSSDIDLKGVDVQDHRDSNNLQVETNLNNLNKWTKVSKDYQSFWSARGIPNKIIPADILRCLFLTKDITISQMKEEFCKHYILFSIFSQAWRIDRKFNNKDPNFSESSLDVPWRPWDLYILKRSQEISAIPIPTTLEEFSDVKLQFDQFLSEFFSYYALIVSEMKAETDSFFQPTESHLPRMVPVKQVLRNILLENQWVQTLYPNLHTHMKNRFQWIHSSNYLAVPTTTEMDEKTRQSNEKLLTIVRIISELESESRQNQLGERGGIYVDLKTPASNWKIVIVNNSLTDPEVRRLLKFNSDLGLQFTQNLEYSRNEDGWSCQKKKMLDPDTYIYLYHNEKHLESNKDLIDDIIDRFDQQADKN